MLRTSCHWRKISYLKQPEHNLGIKLFFLPSLQASVITEFFPAVIKTVKLKYFRIFKILPIYCSGNTKKNTKACKGDENNPLPKNLFSCGLQFILPKYFCKILIFFFAGGLWLALFITMYDYFTCEFLFTRVIINIRSAFLPLQSWRRVFTLS